MSRNTLAAARQRFGHLHQNLSAMDDALKSNGVFANDPQSTSVTERLEVFMRYFCTYAFTNPADWEQVLPLVFAIHHLDPDTFMTDDILTSMQRIEDKEQYSIWSITRQDCHAPSVRCVFVTGQGLDTGNGMKSFKLPTSLLSELEFVTPEGEAYFLTPTSASSPPPHTNLEARVKAMEESQIAFQDQLRSQMQTLIGNAAGAAPARNPTSPPLAPSSTSPSVPNVPP